MAAYFDFLSKILFDTFVFLVFLMAIYNVKFSQIAKRLPPLLLLTLPVSLIATDELLLGDIVISIDKVYEQATEYNHSKTRELAFLVAHSMLHLSGYDHMEDDERRVMEEMQEKILTMKGYTRDYEEN